MLKAALTRFGRLGFVGALLLALATVALPVEGQACAPDRTQAAMTTADSPADALADLGDADDCGDCDTVCAHGCCYAPAVGVAAGSTGPLPPNLISEALALPEPVAIPMTVPSGLERPPRA